MLDEQNTDSMSQSSSDDTIKKPAFVIVEPVRKAAEPVVEPAAAEPTVAGPADTDAAEPHLTSFAPKGRARRTTTTRRKPAATPEPAIAPDPAAEPVSSSEPVAASAEVVAESSDGSSQSPVQEALPAASDDAAPVRTTRRRRTPRPTADTASPEPAAKSEPESTDTAEPASTSDDPIGEALTALGRSRGARASQPAAEAPEAVEALDNLVQAIASGAESDEEASDEDAPARRRRRRRGGRKRRRDSGADEAATGDDEETDESDDSSQAGDDSGDDASKHRRRRRRRRGEDVDDGSDEDAEVVVKVREPRSGKDKSASVTGIDGSTRLEAKKQRRREGRAASRRRAPILSEAEFLARRESVERKMLIRQREEYSQIAVIEDNILVEHYVDRASATSLIGNIYLGKVQNVLPGMEAAFIDIGRGRNAVLYAGEVDWDSFGDKGQNRKIEDVFSAGQLVVVQVSKDPVGAKGARLTSHISIPGRYVVYAPKGHVSGISRKLSDSERNRLKSILDSLVDDAASVVIRTAAEGASEDELVRDVNRLKAQWDVIEKKSGGKQVPQLLYAEPDLTMRIVRDLFTEDFSALIVDGHGGVDDAYETVEAYVNHVAPHLADRIQKWDHEASGDLFAQYRIDEQIAKALDHKVYLPSGGSLVIDRTEAMTVIDVNTGKFTGSGGNLEATVTSNNLEAAEEIVRQLRLRDIGGIIIIDFIDMVLPSNRELLLRRLVECLGRDRTRHQVSEVTSLGLVQLTRKKVGTGLAEAFTKVCDTCDGLGHIRFDQPVDTQAPADGGERHGGGSKRGRRKSS